MGCIVSFLKKDACLEELYELVRVLGEGVEGEVWLANCRKTGVPVAIKLIPRDEDLGLGPEKTRREIQLQARLSHVSIVELKQVILTSRHLGIVMTYEAGGDLHSYCRKYKVDETVARYFMRQIMPALDYCHRHHIAHRDLKLSNFLLTGQDPPRVKLTDFGCAGSWERKKKAPKQRLARFKTFAGTPAYMAPQVLESAFYPTNTYSAVKADVWAVGILLCHIFFGRHTPFWLEPNAFRNEGATTMERLRAMKKGKGGWAHSDDYIAQHVGELSTELRGLLDAIFVADEDERITIQGIMDHPWYKGPLSTKMQEALDDMEEDQRIRDSMARAAVSTAAARHDLPQAATGGYATIDLIVDLAATRKRLPGGERILVLDMAHMDDDGASTASMDTAPTSPSAAAADAAGAHALWAAGAGPANGDPSPPALAPGDLMCPSLPGAEGGGDVSRRGTSGGGDGSRRGTSGGGDGSRRGTSGGGGVAGGAFSRVISLERRPSGLVTASYAREPSAHGGSQHSARSSGGGGPGGAALLERIGGAALGRQAPGVPGRTSEENRTVHGGEELFRMAAERFVTAPVPPDRLEKSWHAGAVYNEQRPPPGPKKSVGFAAAADGGAADGGGGAGAAAGAAGQQLTPLAEH